ncbi:zinc finger protein 567-like [Anoplophora glabripennis]|uniref:zinc finger protein 567-like n=1 Tax=Anoplophora glabripennis TaxID=217634 RepID=UPI000875187D|nr:zinc finger protein 567-like [Anoplophora glabripennis]
MEQFKQKLCGLCLGVIHNNENFKVIDATLKEAVDTLLIKLNTKGTDQPVTCDSCSKKLFAAFEFKITCMNTEHCIFPYVNSGNLALVDLREIYLKERSKEHLTVLSGDEKICRLCMQIVTSGFVSVCDIEADIIIRYIPEINFSSTEDPVICRACLDSLNTHSNFLKDLDVDEQIEQIYSNRDAESAFCIKTEVTEIKTEHDENEDGDALHHNDTEAVEGKAKYTDDLKTQSKHKDISNQKGHRPSHKEKSEASTYKCDVCGYETKQKILLKRHQKIHKNLSEVPVYLCDSCDFKTRHKNNLLPHQLRHRNISQVPTYECPTCGYKTRQKSHLTVHQRTHKNRSEIRMYPCDQCDYESKQKSNLTKHQLKHKDGSEVPLYQCEMCGYVAKRRDKLMNHQLTHKDLSEVATYKCQICDFETKRKFSLTRHNLTHKGNSEVEMYTCDKCDFGTKYKNSLVRHRQDVHEVVSEGEFVPVTFLPYAERDVTTNFKESD